jgi:ribonucleoside-diphosphate reductase alpha chain
LKTAQRILKRNVQPSYIDDFAIALLQGFYLKEDETPNDAIARASEAFCFGDYELAQRIYDYAHSGWFMFASPILSNAPKGTWVGEPSEEDWVSHTATSYWVGEQPRAMPISCFALYVPDSIEGQINASSELAALSVSGGGVGLHNGIRAVSAKAPGPIPYMKSIDAVIGYFRQAESRRGVCAYYMDVDHPDIIEHIRFRIPSGGDSARKSDNRSQFHNAVNVSDKFIEAVKNDEDFDLVCPHSGEVRETLKARYIWEEILETRALTGEPYLFKIDTANRALPESQKKLGLSIKGSNICNEISLVSSEDRTFVCCLSSLNLEKYDEWKDTNIVDDLVRFLDNVLQYFIENAPDVLDKSIFSAKQERAIGLGTMGWHYFLQKNNLPFEGGGFDSPVNWTHRIFSDIKMKAVDSTMKLALERGEPNDMVGTGRRNSHLMALAPNSNNSIIVKTSPSIEPVSGNAYSQTTRAGTFLVKNPHLEKILVRYSTINGLGNKWLEEQWASIVGHSGSVQHLEYLTDHEKEVFKTGFEIDNHWIIEQADARQQYVCQSQSLNLFFPAGVNRSYFNSVHLKALDSEYVKGLYYARMERGINADVVKKIERKTLTDWNSTEDDCIACSG